VFKDREQAGRLLAQKLLPFKRKRDTVVVGVPRGGMPIAIALAKKLNLPFDFIVTKKLGAPGNKELAIGAVGLSVKVHDKDLIERLGVTEEYLKFEEENKRKEIKELTTKFRKAKKKENIKDKRIILVDDGIATGATLEAAILYLRKKRAKEIILAVPVAPIESVDKFGAVVDKIVVLETPKNFYAVGQFYEHFPQITDEEVLKLLDVGNGKKISS